MWERTAEIYREWMSTEGWKNKETVDVPRIQEHTFKVRPYSTLFYETVADVEPRWHCLSLPLVVSA